MGTVDNWIFFNQKIGFDSENPDYVNHTSPCLVTSLYPDFLKR